jgi:hypothetical protein
LFVRLAEVTTFLDQGSHGGVVQAQQDCQGLQLAFLGEVGELGCQQA